MILTKNKNKKSYFIFLNNASVQKKNLYHSYFFHLKHSEKLLLENYRETVFSKLNIKKKLEINFSVFLIKEYNI